MASLEDELGLPSDATLVVVGGGSLKTGSGAKIDLSSKTSIRKGNATARCLLVGRQASVADIRIQHKSISRRHAVLYAVDNQWYLSDLGGKHGSHVNNTRVNGTVPLRNGDQIFFGNVKETIFTADLPQSETISSSDSVVANSNKGGSALLETATSKDTTTTDGKTREEREKQIAAMVASLDETPLYQKYRPSEEEEKRRLPSLQPTQTKLMSKAKKHGLPVADRFRIPPVEDSRRHAVSALAVDKSGSRFAVGLGTLLRLYDFSGMNRQRTTPFKTVEVQEGYNLVHVCYSNTGDRLIAGTGSVQPVILDRDGEEKMQFVRGDMYVTDMARTSGHTAAVTGVDWHPLQRDEVLTGSLDGSARIWNLQGKTQFHQLVCDRVYRAKNARGQRVAVTAVSYHPGGREFVLGTACGSIQVWNATRVGAMCLRAVYHAHSNKSSSHDENKSETSSGAIRSLVFNTGGTSVASRAQDDDTIKIWDYKRLGRSLGEEETATAITCRDAPNDSEHASCDFSPDGRLLVAGTFVHQQRPSTNGARKEVGALKFYNIAGKVKKSVKAVVEIPMEEDAGVVQVKWHAKLNQILVGCSDGSVIVFFDAGMSRNGALITTNKVAKRVDELSQLLASRAPTGSAAVRGRIVAPNEQDLGVFHNKRKRAHDDDEDYHDNINNPDSVNPHNKKVLCPEKPATGFKTGSQNSVTVTFTQFVANSSINQNKILAGKDPREELFKYNQGKSYTGQENEPRILADKTVEEEEEAISGGGGKEK